MFSPIYGISWFVFRAIECYSHPTEYPKRGPDESSDKPFQSFGCAVEMIPSYFLCLPSAYVHFFFLASAMHRRVLLKDLGAPDASTQQVHPIRSVPRLRILWSVLTTSNKLPQSEALGVELVRCCGFRGSSPSPRVDPCSPLGAVRIHFLKDST